MVAVSAVRLNSVLTTSKPTPIPPDSIVEKREDIPHGKLEMIEYESKTVGTTRKMNVYTPPGYSAEKKYPVLYLLHGIGGDETEWQRFATPDVLLDNLIADGKAVPMIVVMPNGRAQKNDRAEGNVMASAPGVRGLRERPARRRDPRHRVALLRPGRSRTPSARGLVDGWRSVAELWPGAPRHVCLGRRVLVRPEHEGARGTDPRSRQRPKSNSKLLWLSCGNKDGLIRISQRLQRYLKENEVPHVWNVDSHGHDPTHWRNNLYHFAQLLFQETSD